MRLSCNCKLMAFRSRCSTLAFGEPESLTATNEEGCDAIPPPVWPEEPIELSFSEIVRASGRLAFAHDAAIAESTFPFLSALIGAQRVSALTLLAHVAFK